MLPHLPKRQSERKILQITHKIKGRFDKSLIRF